MNTADQQQGLMEFVNSAALNLRAVLEADPEISAAQIEAIILKLPQVLSETAPLLAQCNADGYPADVQFRDWPLLADVTSGGAE